MNFFPDTQTNDAFEAWKAEILDCTSHGWVPSDAYLLQVFTEGKLTVDQVARDADMDWEEVVYEQDAPDLYDDNPDCFGGYDEPADWG